jgi:hypothetical protein
MKIIIALRQSCWSAYRRLMPKTPMWKASVCPSALTSSKFFGQLLKKFLDEWILEWNKPPVASQRR